MMMERIPDSNAERTAPNEQDEATHRRAALRYGLLALFSLMVLLSSLYISGPKKSTEPVRIAIPIDRNVYEVTWPQWNNALAVAMSAQARAEGAAKQAIEEEVQTRVSAAFAVPKTKVKEAADWYYSIPGHLARIGSFLGADAAATISKRLFGDTEWGLKQAELTAGLTQFTNAQAQWISEHTNSTLHAELSPWRIAAEADREVMSVSLKHDDSVLLNWLHEDPALERQGIAVSAGVFAGLAARRAAQAAAARLAARAGAAQGSVACAATGPAAWACVAGVFTATLVASEYAIIRIDEVRNRDEFEATLLADIERIETKMRNDLCQAFCTAISAKVVPEQRRRIEKQIRPIDQIFAARSQDTGSGFLR